MQRPALRPLTSLRFLAAIHVVVFHTAKSYLAAGPALVRNLCDTGFVGVGLFFVLSGFILTYNYWSGETMTSSKREFWVARLVRVYPVYALGLLLSTPSFLLDVWRHDGHPLTTLLSAVPAAVFLIQSWIPHLASLWNAPGWSLSTECFFYLGFPFLLPIFARLARSHFFAVVSSCWLTSLAIALGYIWLSPDHLSNPGFESHAFWLTLLKFSPLARLPEFILGIALGSRFLAPPQREPSQALAVVGAAGFLATTMVLSPYLPYPVLHNCAIVPFAALVIYGLGRYPARCLEWSPLVLAGEASYSLYILHSGIWWWFTRVAMELHFNYLQSPSFLAAYLVTAVAISILTYRTVEMPCRNLLRDWFKGKKAAITLPLAAAYPALQER